ncbi:uncharacterized protein LOC111701078 [Eurytemora carolleeae]|uniref:uncharacterized protein LOC111701078 n=1 Tax=Eurytemora carolleeae TaxID=1294199 RepID=UPI000C76268C|nr:uncharacterized protein LOC111701078 [Eurytemora carolleeae]|eukprot:XP_023327989.1 uncharacterized protein LOC111701078 [Eurytemora affinis]
MKIKSTVENYQEMAARFLSRILRKKVISFILFLNIIFLLNIGIIRSVSSSRFQQYPDDIHLKGGLEMEKKKMEKKKMEKKAKNMDEYKPTARQLVTIKEDGRLGNLLLETANLYLIGKSGRLSSG